MDGTLNLPISLKQCLTPQKVDLDMKFLRIKWYPLHPPRWLPWWSWLHKDFLKMKSGEVFCPFVKRSLPNVTTPLFLSSSRNSARGPLSPVYLMPFVPKENRFWNRFLWCFLIYLLKRFSGLKPRKWTMVLAFWNSLFLLYLREIWNWRMKGF